MHRLLMVDLSSCRAFFYITALFSYQLTDCVCDSFELPIHLHLHFECIELRKLNYNIKSF